MNGEKTGCRWPQCSCYGPQAPNFCHLAPAAAISEQPAAPSDHSGLIKALRTWYDKIPVMDGSHILVKQAAEAIAALSRAPEVVAGEWNEHKYATQLLVSLMEKHYPDRSPDWQPLPDLMGVLTQIDNLSTGLVRTTPPAPQPAPSPGNGEVLEALRAKIEAIPRYDRGYHWQAENWRGVESIEAYGTIAAMCKFVLDKQDALIAALSASPPQGEGCATEGCDMPAAVPFERGGVGSHYCATCYLKVQAIPRAQGGSDAME